MALESGTAWDGILDAVNISQLYLSSPRSSYKLLITFTSTATFPTACRHTEDVDLHSVNYLHYGAPKSWYCIAPAHRARFELLLKGFLPDMFRACPEFLRHKVGMLALPDASAVTWGAWCQQTSA